MNGNGFSAVSSASAEEGAKSATAAASVDRMTKSLRGTRSALFTSVFCRPNFSGWFMRQKDEEESSEPAALDSDDEENSELLDHSEEDDELPSQDHSHVIVHHCQTHDPFMHAEELESEDHDDSDEELDSEDEENSELLESDEENEESELSDELVLEDDPEHAMTHMPFHHCHSHTHDPTAHVASELLESDDEESEELESEEAESELEESDELESDEEDDESDDDSTDELDELVELGALEELTFWHALHVAVFFATQNFATD